MSPDVRKCKIVDPNRAEPPQANTRLESHSPNGLEGQTSPKAEFKALQDHWYKALKDSGFVDIEVIHPNYGPETSHKTSLKNPDYHIRRLFEKEPERFEYYNQARQFLASGNFKSSLDEKIWELYSEGMPGREIAKALTPFGFNISHSHVAKLTKSLKANFAEWLKAQRNSNE